MSEQATLTGRVGDGAGVGFGVFVAGVTAAFLAGALMVWLLSAQIGGSGTRPSDVGQAGPGAAPALTDVPTPASVAPLRRAPGAEYRRIPDDGTGSGFVDRTAVGQPGHEDRRIPDDTGTP